MTERPTSTQGIVFTGVGGQGILLCSEITAGVLLAAGYDVKQSEVHGMSQRGGSVSSDLRFGSRVFSPLIPEGEADILVAFERLEALRSLPGLRPGGRMVVSRETILPVGCQENDYPSEILTRLREVDPHLLDVDAHGMALAAGDRRAANMVLAGALSLLLPVEGGLWIEAVEKRFSGRLAEINLQAFRAGREAFQTAQKR